MIRSLILSAIIATPAFAADRTWWGGSPNPDYNTNAVIAPADAPAIATITLTNRLTGGHDMLTTGTIEIPGLSVGVTVLHGPGDQPDTLHVQPPEGFIAVPPQIDVPEGGQGVVTIYSNTGAGA